MTLQIGENVGPYRVTAQLGQGGMATVYKAYHANLDRYVAIKVLHQAFKEDPTFLARFQREAKVLAKLEHPNIVPIYDFAEHNGQPYLVMKFVEGDTLKARMSDGPLTMAEIRKVVDSVGAGLAYAHKQGILHRDVKPSNVIITPEGHYYISDFGLARIAGAGESTLSQDTMLGTPNYISPEQAKGVADVDARADLYSFGVVLYEMVVGRVPYSADTPFATIHDHIYTPLPLPSKVNPTVPEPIERFLLKALAKEREGRFEDATAFVSGFHQALGEAKASATPTAGASVPASGAVSGTATRRAPTAAPTVRAAKAAPVAEAATPAASNTKWFILGGVALALIALVLGALIVVPRLRRTPQLPPTQVAVNTPASLPTRPPATQPLPTAANTPLPPSTQPAPTPADRIGQAEAAVAANPNDPNAHLELGRAYYDARRRDEAVKEFVKAAELSKDDLKVYDEIMQFLFNDPITTLEAFLSGLERDPDNKDLWLRANGALDRAAPLDNAEPTLLNYVATFPRMASPKAALALYYVLHGQPLRAAKQIEELRRDFPNASITHYVSGELLAAQRLPEKAIQEFELALSDPNLPQHIRQRIEDRIKQLKGPSPP
jgi:tRNA A-37 threonylcarbamoyl transferase component Bud32/tetratricopeptide (TPR) repeat protein